MTNVTRINSNEITGDIKLENGVTVKARFARIVLAWEVYLQVSINNRVIAESKDSPAIREMWRKLRENADITKDEEDTKNHNLITAAKSVLGI